MKYVSTRGMAPPLEFGDVLLTGLASDGGLYVPEAWPSFSLVDFVADHGRDASYSMLATEVMWPYVEGSIERDDFAEIVDAAYATFDHPDVTPLVDLGDDVHLLELFHGPTLAFKDVALQLVGRLFDHELAKRGERVTIVAATSGDTGSAAIEAVRDREAIDIFVLHPHERTSPLQRRQMTTVDAVNVHNVAIEGTFDDCQDLVKAMFGDQEFRDRIHMSAVNSINWARVMAQIVYYYWAALQLGRVGEPISFAVPTGNFGNVFAGFCARRMGLDIAQFVVGSNRNDILTRFFDTGEMTIESVEPSLSPSMDIQVSSNLERLLFELHARDGEAVAEFMTTFRETGTVAIDPYKLGALRESWDGARLDDEDTLQEIRLEVVRSGEILDPHTAVGLGAARRCGRGGAPMVVLATAHPAKFPAAIEEAIGRGPDVPARLAAVAELEERFDVLPDDLAVVQSHILDRTRV
ncbi:MAG: threonine synthase [Actinomycetota bacterium]